MGRGLVRPEMFIAELEASLCDLDDSNHTGGDTERIHHGVRLVSGSGSQTASINRLVYQCPMNAVSADLRGYQARLSRTTCTVRSYSSFQMLGKRSTTRKLAILMV